MAKSAAKSGQLVDRFGNALRVEGNDLVVRASDITGGRVIIEGSPSDVEFRPPAAEQDDDPSVTKSSVTKTAYNIGDQLDNGWIVGPRSPTTGHVMVIEPVSGALDGYQTWYKGEEHAKELGARQPDVDELNALYNEVVKADHNQHAQFNGSVSNPCGKYWSSTPNPHYSDSAQFQYFDDGIRHWYFKNEAYARVRSVDHLNISEPCVARLNFL